MHAGRGMIIAIMIIPIITSVSREILVSVPDLQREAAYALGATRWEVTRIAVLSYARRGIFGAVTLGLGRALGETMAVTMVIGNKSEIAASLFAPGYTLASVIASQFAKPVNCICNLSSRSASSSSWSRSWSISWRNLSSNLCGRHGETMINTARNHGIRKAVSGFVSIVTFVAPALLLPARPCVFSPRSHGGQFP